MPFHVLFESTTADPTDVLDNFYHIAQGSRLPMDGVTMGYTNNALDLGSSSVRWNNLICTNIDTSSVTASYAKMPIVLVDYALATETTDLSLSGMNGDRSICYRIIVWLNGVNTTGNFALNTNGPTGTNHGGLGIVADGASISGTSYTPGNYFLIVVASSGSISLSDSFLYVKSGNYRVVNSQVVQEVNGEYVSQLIAATGVDGDTSTVTSIYFGGSLPSGSRIIVMGMDNQ